MMGSPLVRVLARAARCVLLAYPRPFRGRYGGDMTDVFIDVCLARSRGRRARMLTVGGGTLLSMLRGGLAERFGSRAPQPRYSLPQGRPERPGEMLVTGLVQDLRFAFRSLLNRPAFTALVVGMLALGVAANAAIFTGLNSVVLRPLPFPESDRLLRLDEVAPEWGLESVSVNYPNFHHWHEANRTFESMAVYDNGSFNLSVDGRPDRVGGAFVHWRLLEVLGLEPVIGRDFTVADWVEGAPRVALVSERFWRDRMQPTEAALGQTIRLDSEEFVVIGVYPDRAVLPIGAQVWTLLSTRTFCCELEQNRGSWWLEGIGRLKPGVSIDQALADLRAIHAGLVEEYGSSREAATPRLDPLHELLVEDSRPMLLILSGAVGILLLIACANIAGLLLARAAQRGREIGIRAALGAGRARLVRQLLTESLLVSAVGGVLGVAAGYLAMAQLFRVMPDSVRGWMSIQADWRFLGYATLVSTVTSLLFGMAPALAAARTSAGSALQESGTRGSAAAGRRRALSSLVIGEVALAVVLLVGAGLLADAFRSMADRDLGFRDDAMTFSLALPDQAYTEPAAQHEFWRRIEERVALVGGVESFGLTNLRPMQGHLGYFFDAEEATALTPDEPSPVILTRFATRQYFDTIGVTFLRGRPFADDLEFEVGEPFGAVVNESFARKFWGEIDVVGRRIRTGGEEAPWLPIVGVIRDTLHYGPDTPMRPGVFLPFWARTGARGTGAVAYRTADAHPEKLMAAMREAVREVDPDIPLFGIGLLRDHVTEDLWSERMYAALLGTFAAVALVLALGGIYSTLSYTVSDRRAEIGIRMALGAQRRQVLREVIGSGMRVATVGIALGLVLAWLAAGLVAGVLEGADPRQPSLYVGVAAVLALTALCANLFPARRAAGTDPVSAMRAA